MKDLDLDLKDKVHFDEENMIEKLAMRSMNLKEKKKKKGKKREEE